MDEKTLVKNALNKIKALPYVKIGLLCEPPFFVHDSELKTLTKNFDYINEDYDVRNSLIELLKTQYAKDVIHDLPWLQDVLANWPIDIAEAHIKVTIPEVYSVMNKWHSFFLLERMSERKIVKPTMFVLPIIEVDYNNYFDKLIMLRCNDTRAYEESNTFCEHVKDEGIDKQLELDLTRTQRLHFNQVLSKCNWQCAGLAQG